jgi:hypothetical protein
MSRLLNLVIKRRRPVMLVGGAGIVVNVSFNMISVESHFKLYPHLTSCCPLGTGKTSIMRNFLASLPEENFMSATINLNNYTDAKSLQKIVRALCLHLFARSSVVTTVYLDGTKGCQAFCPYFWPTWHQEAYLLH